jgi:MORN repeat variant
MHVERADYDDGGWCEQQYVDGKLHGYWTVYYPSGKKKRESEYQRGRQEGYQREWDELGNLREEQWYHLGVLHGQWKEWDENGVEEVVGDFLFGTAKPLYEKWPPKPHSNWERVFPYWMWEPAQFRSQIAAIERELALPTRRLTRDTSRSLRDEFGASYFSYVNVLGSNEEWPTFEGVPLIPLLQLDCRGIVPLPHFLDGVVFLIMFSRSDPTDARRDLVIRTYRNGDSLRHVRPPPKAIAEQPNFMQVGKVEESYPDANDLPPGLRAMLEEETPDSPILKANEHRFSTRFGGWPAWLQWSGVYSYGEFVLQVDRLDVQTLRGGDSAVHYFFNDGANWTWASESLSPLYDPSGPH